MKVLVVNPNTSQEITERINSTVQKYAASTTECTTLRPEYGPRSIESIYDALLSSPGTLEAVIPHLNEYDAFLMACYADHPVISAVREITDKPVVGMAEASMHMACMLGHRFSIVTSTNPWIPLLYDGIQRFGLSTRCASVRAIGLPVLTGPAETLAAITQVAQEAVLRDGAEVICLGSASMTGLDKPLEQILKVPVLDGIVCGLKFLEGMGAYGVGTSKRLAYSVPHQKEQLNLSPIFQKPYFQS